MEKTMNKYNFEVCEIVKSKHILKKSVLVLMNTVTSMQQKLLGYSEHLGFKIR